MTNINAYITKNNENIRKVLEDNGFSKSSTFSDKEECIFTCGKTYYSTNYKCTKEYFDMLYGFNCFNNDGLFLAISTLAREDDKNKLYIFTDMVRNDEHWVVCDSLKIDDFCNKNNLVYDTRREARFEDLLKHFNYDKILVDNGK